MERILAYFGSYKFIFSVCIVAAALVCWLLLRHLIHRFTEKITAASALSGRRQTYLALALNSVRGLLALLALILVLQVHGVNVSSLIAGLGIIGAIVGLALQDMLKDVIMGTNILTGEYFAVGDVIKYGDLIGEVQSMGFDHVLLENVQFPSAQNGKQDFGSTGGRDRSAQLAADIAAWNARFEGSVTLWYGYSLGQVTDGASTVGGSATALGVRNLVIEVPAKQTMDDTARNELRDTLSASGVERAVFWDDAAGIFQ